MANGLLGGIINPAQTDVLGSLAQGRERQATDLAGELLGQTVTGQIGDLARLSPDKFLKFAEATGTPINSEGRIKNLIGINVAAAKLLDAGQPEFALQFLQEEISKIEQTSGQPATKLRAVAQAIQSGDQETINNFVQSGRKLDPTNKPVSALDVAKTGKAIAETAEIEQKTLDLKRKGPDKPPETIIENLSSSGKARAIEAFNLAGGGKDGVKAMNAQIALDETTQQREDVPQLLDASFPNASPAERAQLDAAVQGAKTVESGLKTADKIRTEQRRLKKAKGFQERAIELLNGIVASDQLGDVTGSIEGGIDFRFTDVESELIADINEAQNILTAENMDLMTGVLSESDIKLLKNLSSGALNRLRGEERFKKDAQTLLEKLSSALVQTVDDRQGGGGSAEIDARRQRLAELRAKAGR